ncbi:hypothetical protein BDP27DRAFT_1340462, partial [Rhodocollybia butyracea]
MIPSIHSPPFLQSYICFMLIPPLPLMFIVVFHPLYFFWLFLSFLLSDYYLSLLRSLSTLYIVLYHVKYSRLEILLNPLTCVLLCVPVSRFICFFNSVSSLHCFHNLCSLLSSIWFRSVALHQVSYRLTFRFRSYRYQSRLHFVGPTLRVGNSSTL